MTKQNNNQNYQQEIGAILAISAGSLLMTAYKTYKEYLTKSARKCDTFTGRDKTLCMTKFKMEGTRAQMEKLRKSLSKCQEAKYPQKCQEKLQEKISKLQKKHKELEKKFNMVYDLVKKGEKERKPS